MKFHFPDKAEYYIYPSDTGGGQKIYVKRIFESAEETDIESLAQIEIHQPGPNQPKLRKLLEGNLGLSKKRLDKLEAEGSLNYKMEGFYPSTIRKVQRMILGEVRSGYELKSHWPIGRPTVTEHYALKLPANYVGWVWATRSLEQENHEPLLEMFFASLDPSGLENIDPYLFQRWGLRFPHPENVDIEVTEHFGGTDNSAIFRKEDKLFMRINDGAYEEGNDCKVAARYSI